MCVFLTRASTSYVQDFVWESIHCINDLWFPCYQEGQRARSCFPTAFLNIDFGHYVFGQNMILIRIFLLDN